MMSAADRRYGWTILVMLLHLTLFPVQDLATAEQSDVLEGRASPVGEVREDGEEYNQYARFIAGMPVVQEEWAALQGKPAWVEYSRFFDRAWKSLSERLLIPERRWAEKELGDAADWEGTIFYPFSGPDFANVNAFFPRARTYVLVALETLGEIPDFNSMTDQQFKSYFQAMKNSLRDLLNINYFISAHMDAEIERTEIKGVLPVLLFMLARNQAEVLDVRYLNVGLDGKFKDFPALGTTARGFPALKAKDLDLNNIPGIRITFHAAGSEGSDLRTLYYFRLDLSNPSFERNRHFLAFLRGLAPFSTFMKSASYVMFDNRVSTARQFVLDHSRYVVQEDSGIPLKYFDPSLWTLRFHGRYVKPISTFSQKHQEALASIYRADKKIKPLPFGFGYYFQPGSANLMFAEKKPIDRGKDDPPLSHPDGKHFLYNRAILERRHGGG